MGSIREHFSIREAAARLHVSESTVKREIRRGELTARHVGGQIRIDELHLQTYLTERTSGAGRGAARKSRVGGRRAGSKTSYAATDAADNGNLDVVSDPAAQARSHGGPPVSAHPRRPLHKIQPPFSRDGVGGEGRVTGGIGARPKDSRVAVATSNRDAFTPAGASSCGASAPEPDAPAISGEKDA